MHERQQVELKYAQEAAAWHERCHAEAGDEDEDEDEVAAPVLPPQPGPLRNKRRAVFVAEVHGKLCLCPIKDNVDLGGAEVHDYIKKLYVVKDASK